jgi:hypothetical protein
MCLDRIISRPEATTLVEDGWKKFSKKWTNSKVLQFENMQLKDLKEVPLDKWVSAEIKPVTTTLGAEKYDTGFHIYEMQKEASDAGATRRVYYRKVHTIGVQDGKRVVIADEMYVPSDPEAWPPKELSKV